MTECRHCNVFHPRLSCPYCGAYSPGMAKVTGKQFRKEDYGTSRQDITPMTVRVLNERRGNGRRYYEV